MKKVNITITIILALVVVTKGERIGSFSDAYFKTPILRVDDTQFYIVDQELKKGFIYDRASFKKVAEFGESGQGPGEFGGISGFTVDNKYLYVTNFPRLSIFSKKGKLIREINLKIFTGPLVPIGKCFIGYRFSRRTHSDDLVKIQFSLYNSNLKKRKDIFFTEIEKFSDVRRGKRIIYMIRDCAESFVYKERIYIGTTEKGFYFSVFDKNGNKLYEIKRKVKSIKIPEVAKKKMISRMRKNMGDAKWNQVEVIIRDYLPAYKAFFVSDDKIFVFRYPQKNYEIFILDLEGNLLKKKYITYTALYKISSRYSCMNNGKLYNMIDMHNYWDLIETDIWNYDASREESKFIKPARELYSKFINYIKRIFFFL